ncbi:patatin-like phospholipase family protein [Hahella aquimaris]|uniref:patatin-like phospholipase family protein n=1 Tax=Hahella sp. HNIBRBA332 TaxID=3015983 RepID=UPI00273C55F3|nr:patatin-like phospholipase family protein [Hahella sp. HNIBRBA332]WLQ17020.1 patatin-like phospholipase family protein [Hahella sp. HNIBRBA332]
MYSLVRSSSVLILLAALCSGCASQFKPQNEPIKSYNSDHAYRFRTYQRDNDLGETLLILAFSGGGTRASALSYGVMEELKDTRIEIDGVKTRLLDEVDYISAVSGGSFTAAYYGLFGDKLFSDYEKVFLRQSVQGALLWQLLSPGYWWRSLFTRFDRTEMAVEYYDNYIFKGKTFADIPLSRRPFININATDLSQGNRFSFDQDTFDLLCSDLDKFNVARAVTASSAVPVAFPSIVLKNHGGDCDLSESAMFRMLNESKPLDIRQRELVSGLLSYNDSEQHPYIHLVDGGISDNLGLRGVIDGLQLAELENAAQDHTKKVKRVAVILVNAEVRPKRGIDESPNKPSITDTIDAVTNAQIQRYNVESRAILQDQDDRIVRGFQRFGRIPYYFIEVNFQSFTSPSLKEFFNSLPTSLELSNREIDTLIQAGRSLLRNSEEYSEFLENYTTEMPDGHIEIRIDDLTDEDE